MYQTREIVAHWRIVLVSTIPDSDWITSMTPNYIHIRSDRWRFANKLTTSIINQSLLSSSHPPILPSFTLSSHLVHLVLDCFLAFSPTTAAPPCCSFSSNWLILILVLLFSYSMLADASGLLAINDSRFLVLTIGCMQFPYSFSNSDGNIVISYQR